MPTWAFVLWYGTLMTTASAFVSLILTNNWTSTITMGMTVLVLSALIKFREFEDACR